MYASLKFELWEERTSRGGNIYIGKGGLGVQHPIRSDTIGKKGGAGKSWQKLAKRNNIMSSEQREGHFTLRIETVHMHKTEAQQSIPLKLMEAPLKSWLRNP